MFGTYIILNLFVAILLSQMGSEESAKEYQREQLTNYAKQMFEREEPEESQVQRLVMMVERQRYLRQRKDKKSKWKRHRDTLKIEGKSLGCFAPTNRFRIWCHTLVHWSFFEALIDLLILINCVFLAMESPAASEKRGDMFTIADILFTAIFLLEFFLKVVALGAFKQPFRSKRKWKRITDDEKLVEWTGLLRAR